MATCKECKSFFQIKENPQKGDCVQRVVDPRQGYWKAKTVDAGKDASNCKSYAKK